MLAPVISWYFRQRYKELQQSLANALENQTNILQYLVEKGANTQIGKLYRLDKVKSYSDFSAAIPLQTYEDLQPYIGKTMNAEEDVIWPGQITWFAKSSGTTSNVSKFIPISHECLEDTHFKGGRDILTTYCNFFPETKMFQGKGLLIGGSHKVNQINEKTFSGDLSAVLMNHLPLWANLKSTPDLHIKLMENWEEKVVQMAHATINENVTSISGVPTWTLVLFKKILEITGKKNIHEIWPNLELFIHGGVSFAPYKKQFSELLPLPQMQYLETYNASEGFFGLQTNLKKSELQLMTNHGIFYEFYAVGDTEKKCISLKDVELNTAYAVVISTNSGLWRYEIGDTILFTDIQEYFFKITGRTKLFINAFGEELVIENAETALTNACEKFNVSVSDYTAAPIYTESQNPGHEWLIEFENLPENLSAFANYLDLELQKNNSDYEAKRKGNLAMHCLKIIVAPTGTFTQWQSLKGKLGGQNKVPRLCNDRIIFEEILRLMVNGY